MSAVKKIYMASDQHFGASGLESSLEREKKFVRWLGAIQDNAEAVYLLGDLFDFWFEYRRVVPRGYARLLGKLAELTDGGIEVSVFAGNHDMWYRDYFPNEIGAQVYFEPVSRTFFGKRYFLAHGDGIGPGDYGYKALKKFLRHPLTRWTFARLHPNLGFALATKFSKTSRKATHKHELKDYGEQELMLRFARQMQADGADYDYYVFGHRHLPKRVPAGGAELIVLGDWLTDYSYLEIGPEGPEMKTFAG